MLSSRTAGGSAVEIAPENTDISQTTCLKSASSKIYSPQLLLPLLSGAASHPPCLQVSHWASLLMHHQEQQNAVLCISSGEPEASQRCCLQPVHGFRTAFVIPGAKTSCNFNVQWDSVGWSLYPCVSIFSNLSLILWSRWCFQWNVP